ncbi:MULTISPECIES: PQQ-binding-like beta-propeller repeat protein [unclassified Streptomyces]|uniref:protein kinase domain-containing protein n=1 Tax=unclassified Streptomyces TaxID=2593676 RepID=UPI00336A5AF2
MASPLTHDDPRALGPYRLIARLGAGGMGVVYLGRSSGGRTVALKTMHARTAADAEFRTRFRLETDAARVIGGKYGAAVIDADPLAETPWLATEYVLGPPLDEAVALCGPLPERCVRPLGAALCEALGRLHASDVVHRDLKPSNILLTAFGPKVIDFGIARALGDDRLTRTGRAAGTPAFMSPEQATGGEHTPAGDVFALAGVLVFAATGAGPFGGGQPADLLYRVRYGEPDLTRVPDGLRPVLRRCLAKDPARRPGTDELRAQLHDGGGEFADHLPDLLLADIARRCVGAYEIAPPRLPAPAEAPEPAPDSDARPSSRRPSRRTALALAGGGALALAGAGYGVWAWRSSGGSGPGPDTGPSPTARAANVPPDAAWRRETPEISLREAPQIVGSAVTLLTDDGTLALDARRGTRLWTSDAMDAGYAMTTDGKSLFALQDRHYGGALTVTRVDPKTGDPGSAVVRATRWEPYSTTLLTATSDALYAISHDKKVSRLDKGWYLLAFDLGSGAERWRQPFARSMPSDDDAVVVASVSGRRLLLAGGNGLDLEVRDTRTGARLWRRRVPTDIEFPESLSRTARGQLALSPTHVYIGADEVFAVRLSDGKISWRFGKGREVGEEFEARERRYGPPAVRGGVVYAAEGDRGFVALDGETGKLRWAEKPTGLAADFYGAPLVGDRYVYGTVDSRRWISAVDLTRHTSAWTFNAPEGGGIGRAAVAHRQARRAIMASGHVVAAIPLE